MTVGGESMRDLMDALPEKTEPMWRQEEERSVMPTADADEETFHLQADGFYGSEKGFHDGEQLRKQQRPD